MGEREWPQPPIRFEDLPLLIELCGGWAKAKRELTGWVPVRPPSLTSHRSMLHGALRSMRVDADRRTPEQGEPIQLDQVALAKTRSGEPVAATSGGG